MEFEQYNLVITWMLQMVPVQGLVREHGYTFCNYKLINFFQVVMLTIIFVYVINKILNVGYSKHKANRLR